ncbi:MAG: NAD(P)-dependent oxidoreductase [Cyanobacteria bacterium P01_C01_bin.70]
MDKKVLVTGSSGFIGSHLCTYLASEGYYTIGLDIQPCQINDKQSNFVLCDILDREKLTYVIRTHQPDVIVHLAARTDLNEKNTLQGYAVNIEGTENLVAAIKDNDCVERVLFTSSQLVCDVKYVPKNDTDYRPPNLYGESKVLTEKIVRSGHLEGVTWCILRPTTIWGEGMSPHYQNFLRLVQIGRFFHVSSRPLYKSYGYIGNTIYQYKRFIEASIANIHQQTFYIADYKPLSLREWTNCLAYELSDRPLKTIPVPVAKLLAYIGDGLNTAGLKKFPFNSFRLKNILTEYMFDLSNTEKICGPLPFSMQDGVRRTAQWFQSM